MFKVGEEEYSSYQLRNQEREKTLLKSTMNFVQYFVDLGDDLVTAQIKVSQTSDEVADKLYLYVMGNTQPLIDALNSSVLAHMDASAKAKITGDLSV